MSVLCPNVTINNIVYCDTVIPLNEMGENVKTASIYGVSSVEAEECLQIVANANPGVKFITTQYSREDEKIVFYTDKPISTSVWYQSKLAPRIPVETNKKTAILSEIDKVLNTDSDDYDDCVSLYTINEIIRYKKRSYKEFEENCNDYLNELLKSNCDDDACIEIDSFDYKTNELIVKFNYFCDDYPTKLIYLKKYNGDLQVTKSESCWDTEMMTAIGDELSLLFDKIKQEYRYNNQFKRIVNPVNSNFDVKFNQYGSSIFPPTVSGMEAFYVTLDPSKDIYSYDCNSNDIISYCKKHQEELFNKIQIRISDCPEWMQEIIKNIKEQQLEKEREKQLLLEEEKAREDKKQNRMKTLKHVFSIFKK